MFDFLQLKDPFTYFKLKTIGLKLTNADKKQIWVDIRNNQERILKNKKIKHRNFGVYSKHNCGIESCPYNGVMVKSDSFMKEHHIKFDSDKTHVFDNTKKYNVNKERKNKKNIIKKQLEDY